MKSIKITATIFFSVFTFFANGQIDEKKMDRDLGIAHNVLQTLKSEESQNDNLFYHSTRAKSDYIPKYGVMIFYNMPSKMIFRTSGRRESFVYSVAPDVEVDFEFDDKEKTKTKTKTKVKQKEKAPRVVVTRANGFVTDGNSEDINTKMDSVRKANKARFKEVTTTFFKDYAHLIGQLQPNEKIVITTSEEQFETYYYSNHRTSGGITAEVLKSDIDAYQRGKLSEKAFEGKIVYTENKESKTAKDLTLFGSIINKAFSEEFSDSYYTNYNNIRYNWFDNMGAVFYMKVYSSVEHDDHFYIKTIDKKVPTKAERDKVVEGLYGTFVKDLKTNILDYGSTVKSLQDDEMLWLNVSLTRCDCGIPKVLELGIKIKDVKDYASGKINAESALAKFIEKKH